LVVSYFVHQRKNYFASVRMYSSRQNNVEEPYNEEGLKNHHLPDGSNFFIANWQRIY
jgi:chondroitin AC lyase